MIDSGAQAILLKMVEQIRDDLASERQESHEHRARVHSRLDEVQDRLSRLDTTVALAGQVDAQVRDELDALGAKVDANQAAVAPSVEEWRRIRMLGLGIVGLMALGGVSVGAAIVWGGNTLVELVRHWLRIQ